MAQLPDVAIGVTLAVLSLLIYGVCMVIVSVGMRRLGSEPGSLLSIAAGLPTGLAVVVLQLAFGSPIAWPSAWAVASFALAGILSTYLGRWLVFKSIGLIGPSGASAVLSTSPLITALFAWVFLREHIGWLGLLGITIGMLGLAGTSLGLRRRDGGASSARPSAPPGPGRPLVFGALIVGLGSAAAYSSSHIFRASAVRDWNEPLLGVAIGTVAGLLTLMLASRKRLAQHRRDIAADPVGARIFLLVGVLQFLAQGLVIASLRYIPVSVAALISMCTPLVVMPISWLVLRNQEKLNWATVLGILVTVGGTALSIVAGARG